MNYKEYLDKKIVVEKSLRNITIEDIVNKQYYNELKNSDNWDRYKETYARINDIDEDDIDEQNFEKWLKVQVELKFDDVYDEIYDHIENGKIKIYRMLDIDNDDYINHLLKQGKHLGIYWSFDESGADLYWGKGKKNKILIVSEIDEQKINWIETIYANMDYSIGENEMEIRLFKGTPIKIIELYINKEPVDIKELENKIFKA